MRLQYKVWGEVQSVEVLMFCTPNAQAEAPQLGGEAPEGVLAGDLQEEKEDEEQGEGSASEGEEEGWKVVCRSRR